MKVIGIGRGDTGQFLEISGSTVNPIITIADESMSRPVRITLANPMGLLRVLQGLEERGELA